MGDSQPGYDIVTSKAAFIDSLQRAGMSTQQISTFNLNERILIQVKAKLNEAPSGKASVVHCPDSNLRAMTHLAIVLVDPGARVEHGDPAEEGLIVHAWLMTRDRASELRFKKGQEQYINVNKLKKAASSHQDIFDIKEMLSFIVDAQIEVVAH
jgi:hypothetical protein